MYDGFLGVRASCFIANRGTRAIAGVIILGTRRTVAEAIVPSEPDLILTCIVAFEVFNEYKVGYGKTPDSALAD